MSDRSERTPEQRLESLERAQRRLTGITVMLGLVVVALGLWQFLPVRSLEAERLVLRDRQHRARVIMLTQDDGTVMVRLNNDAEKARTIWSLAPDGETWLRLSDSTGTTRAEIAVDATGDPSLTLAAADGRTRTRLGLTRSDGRPALALRAEDGTPFWDSPTPAQTRR